MIKFHTAFELLWFSIKHANTYAEAIMNKRKLHTFVSDLITNHNFLDAMRGKQDGAKL